MKISINEPCNENWDKMKPNDKGAFCLSCQKNVVDFSAKTVAEIKDFFNELPSSNNVCGRFKENQLNEMSFDHFLNEFMNWKFVKKIAVIFFLSLGGALFTGCSTPEEKHLVGELEVVQDTTKVVKQINDTLEKNVMMLGEPAIVKDETKCEENKNTIGNNRNKHLMGGPTVQRDTVKHEEKLMGKPVITKENK